MPRPDVWPGFETEMGQFDEGYMLEFSPLMSLDGRMVDAAIKLNLDQVEKVIPVPLDVPSAVAPRQRSQLDVLQTSQFRACTASSSVASPARYFEICSEDKC